MRTLYVLQMEDVQESKKHGFPMRYNDIGHTFAEDDKKKAIEKAKQLTAENKDKGIVWTVSGWKQFERNVT